MKNAATNSIVILSVMCWLLLSLTAYLGFALDKKKEELSAVSAAFVQLTLEKAQPLTETVTEISDTCPDVPIIDDSGLVALRMDNSGLKSHLASHHIDVQNLTSWLRKAEKEIARLRDLNDEQRGYTIGP